MSDATPGLEPDDDVVLDEDSVEYGELITEEPQVEGGSA